MSAEEIREFQDTVAEMERQLQQTIFADSDFDPESWLSERGL